MQERLGLSCSIVISCWCSLRAEDPHVLGYFLREHFWGSWQGFCHFRHLVPAVVPLKWVMSPLAGQLITSERLPFLFSNSFICCTPMWVSWVEPPSTRPVWAPFSKPTSGRWEMDVPSLSIRTFPLQIAMSLPSASSILQLKGCVLATTSGF